jgi:hypothetical protein
MHAALLLSRRMMTLKLLSCFIPAINTAVSLDAHKEIRAQLVLATIMTPILVSVTTQLLSKHSMSFGALNLRRERSRLCQHERIRPTTPATYAQPDGAVIAYLRKRPA